jgi:hypothetical protein
MSFSRLASSSPTSSATVNYFKMFDYQDRVKDHLSSLSKRIILVVHIAFDGILLLLLV